MEGLTQLGLFVGDLAQFGFQLAMLAGCTALPLMLVVLLIQLCCRRWLTAGQMALLWGLVLVRMLIPIAPSSPISLQGAAIAFVERCTTSQEAVPQLPIRTTTAAELEAASPRQFDEIIRQAAGQPAPIEPSPLETVLNAALSQLPILWLGVGALIVLRTLISHGRLCRQVRRESIAVDAEMRQLWNDCRALANVRHCIPILQFDGFAQPAILGYWRPRLLLPSSALELSMSQLRMVMLHELAHVRRHDVASNWLLLLIHALQWWNPVYYLASARFKCLREQACDAFVIRRLADQPMREYSELLLALAGHRMEKPIWRIMLPASLLGIFPVRSASRSVVSRLKSLRTATAVQGRVQRCAVAALLLAVAWTGLTNESQSSPPPVTIDEFLKQPRTSDVPEPTPDPALGVAKPVRSKPGGPIVGWRYEKLLPVVTRTYDVSKVLAYAAPDAKSQQYAREILLITFLQITLPGKQSELTNSKSIADQIKRTNSLRAGRDTATIEGEKLTVVADEPSQGKIAECLDAWARSGTGQIAIETRFIDSAIDLATPLGVSWSKFDAFSSDPTAVANELPGEVHPAQPPVRTACGTVDYLPTAVATVTKRQADALCRMAQTNSRTKILQSPKLTVFNGQRAFVSDTWERPFVVGIERTQGKGKAWAAQPKIEVIDCGTTVALRAVRSNDQKKIRLQGRLQLSDIAKVHEATEVFPDHDAVTIQAPEVDRNLIDISSDVEDGHSLLVGMQPNHGDKKHFYVLITAKYLDDVDEILSPVPVAQ